MASYRNKSTDRLFEIIKDMKTADECREFFEDLCTIKEIKDMAQRLDTAILLDKGYNYVKIAEEVGISTATISRVSRALRYGSGGYRAVIDSIKTSEEA